MTQQIDMVQAPSPQVMEAIDRRYKEVSTRHFASIDEYHALWDLKTQHEELSPDDEARMKALRDEIDHVSRPQFKEAMAHWCLVHAQEYVADCALTIPGVRFPDWDLITIK